MRIVVLKVLAIVLAIVSIFLVVDYRAKEKIRKEKQEKEAREFRERAVTLAEVLIRQDP